MKLVIALVAASLSLASQCLAAPAKPSRIVLPSTVAPERYELRVTPNAQALSFDAQERVTLTVRTATDRIVLNAADLDFRSVALEGRDERPRIVIDKVQQTAAFVFATPLAPGRYVLSIDYAGRIFQQASGLFALDYPGPDGAKQRALFTQFENSDARRFLPSWDEPGIRSVFALTVIAPADEMAVSNMPVTQTTPLADGRQAVRFADSPKMSSYLLFLALGDFERIHRQVGATDVGVVVRRGDTAKGEFALDAAVRLLGFYNDYFATPYPLPKLDLIAGPGRSQFFAAMENWGAIFYFDYALLLDPKLSTENDRQQVFVTVAHEMAHQWFGDLVTMAWWDDLWLNEGFASWMENKATNHFHPEWNIWLQTKAGEQGAMQLDARVGNHPVITPIYDVFAAGNAFDSITYQKGHAVIRMIESYVGENAFRAGVRRYMADHAYGNTVSDDFWSEIDKVAPRKITAMAHDFTLQGGVPLIRAASDATGVRLTQARFGADPVSRKARSWRTPVRVSNNGAAWEGVVSAAVPARITAKPASAILINAGQTGYFRSGYSADLWNRLLPEFPRTAPEDQAGLLYDSLALGEAGLAPMTNFLQLARRAQDATDPIVLQIFANQLDQLNGYYDRQPGEQAWHRFARARLRPVLERIGWDAKPGEPDNNALLRRSLIGTLGRLDDPDIIAEARRRFAASLRDPGTLQGAQRLAVLRIVAAHADASAWDQLHSLARAATDVTDRSRLYANLGSARDTALADKALALALGGEPSPTDIPDILRAVAAVDPDKAFAFALLHRKAIEQVLEPAVRVSYFGNLAEGSRDPAMLVRLQAFSATVPNSTRGEIEKASATIRHRLSIIKLRLPEANHWLAAQSE